MNTYAPIHSYVLTNTIMHLYTTMHTFQNAIKMINNTNTNKEKQTPKTSDAGKSPLFYLVGSFLYHTFQ